MSATQGILDALTAQLRRQQDDSRPTVVMMCGLSGAGKSSLSHAIIDTYPHFTRISVDAIVYEKHGRYNIDYDPSLYGQYQDEAQPIYKNRLKGLLASGKDAVLDRSFYAREDRDAYKKLIGNGGGRWVLVYLRCTDQDRLWRRIERRKAMRDTLVGERRGDATFDVTREILADYWEGWEAPNGEGEIVFDVV